jgi:HPt (histidine-containing phosphotransfer) domain-containing protein
MTTAPVLDPAVIEGLRQLNMPGEPDVLAEVLKMFLQEVPPRIDRLRNAYAAADIQEVRRIAHSLKGSAGNIGARPMFGVCKQLDESADLESARPLIDALGTEFGRVQAEIRRLTTA